MLSKNKQKLITSLAKKKYRNQFQLFVGEGDKLVRDLLETPLTIESIIATEAWILQNKSKIDSSIELITAMDESIKKVSQLISPPPVIAIFKKPQYQFSIGEIKNELSLFLDDIQDPGNLGTIIRLADWFGIKHLICSTGTVDCFNSKTIQSTMGAIARVKIHYIDSHTFFEQAKNLKIPVYGTYLEGKNIYSETLSDTGIIVMGNEGNGIAPELEKYISDKLFIPNYPANALTSESLNVSVATAIVCAEFRRRTY